MDKDLWLVGRVTVENLILWRQFNISDVAGTMPSGKTRKERLGHRSTCLEFS